MAVKTMVHNNGGSSTEASPLLLHSIHPKNFLSFGPDTPEIPLGSLNVLIGANGSGKSNLIEAVCLLRASPTDLQAVVRKGGGVREWIWKGKPKESALLGAVVTNPQRRTPLRHIIEFGAENQGLHLLDEQIEDEHPDVGKDVPYFYYRYQGGRPVVNLNGEQRGLKRESVEADESILAQRRDPEQYPEITYLADQYGKISAYREWAFGRTTVFREPQPADMRSDRLEEDFSNLGLFLNQMRLDPRTKMVIL